MVTFILNPGDFAPRTPLHPPSRKRYGETSPKLEERRRALACGDPNAPAPLAWLTRVARS